MNCSNSDISILAQVNMESELSLQALPGLVEFPEIVLMKSPASFLPQLLEEN